MTGPAISIPLYPWKLLMPCFSASYLPGSFLFLFQFRPRSDKRMLTQYDWAVKWNAVASNLFYVDMEALHTPLRSLSVVGLFLEQAAK